MPDTCVKLPNVPFDGQIFIDYQRIKWRWDSVNEVWWRQGTADEIPPADEETSGLLAATDKVLLDSIPLVGGGFGFIVSPQLVLQAPWNPSGVMQGDITIHSDSLLIECIDRHGLTLTGTLSGNDPIDVYNDPVPGLRFSLSTEFLNTLCLEVYGSQGLAGEKGETGDTGNSGYTNSPAGEQGDSGRDALISHTFNGIKIIELTTIQDSAVVDLDLDQNSGILSYTVAKMNVPENDEPADELIITPTVRVLSWQTDGTYRTLDDWVLGIPAGDPLDDDPDLTLLQMAPDAHQGRSIEVSRISLTDYITQVTTYYKELLTQYETTYLAEIKEFIELEDQNARTILAGLAHQLSECEWTRPLQFCMGIQAEVCQPDTPPESTPIPTTTTEAPTTTGTGTTGTTGTGTTGTTVTTAAPTTTLPPDEFCDEGSLGNDYFCASIDFHSWHLGEPVVSDCCYSDCFYAPDHRLERAPGYTVWFKDMTCALSCFPDQDQLVLTFHEDVTRLWVNLILQDSSANPLVWWQIGLSKPVDCSTVFQGLAIPLHQLNDLTCGGELAVGPAILTNHVGSSC